MAEITSLAVYCGSRLGEEQAHRALGEAFGVGLAERGIRLVFGGGRVGMMGVIADATLAAGGEVVGVIPEHLNEREIAHGGATELVVVDSMHARKHRMFTLSDAFVAFPGGIGTLDETIEILTWRQLGPHDKPLYLMNHRDHWRPLLELLEHVIRSGFADRAIRRLYEVTDDLETLFTRLAEGSHPSVPARPEQL